MLFQLADFLRLALQLQRWIVFEHDASWHRPALGSRLRIQVPAALRRGGKYIIVGLFGGKASLPLATLPLKPFSIIGSYVGRLDEARELIALMQKGVVAMPPVEERPAAQGATDLLMGIAGAAAALLSGVIVGFGSYALLAIAATMLVLALTTAALRPNALRLATR